MGTAQDRRDYLKRNFDPQEELKSWCDKHTPQYIYDRLTASILGQDDACRKVATLVYGFISNVSRCYENAKPTNFWIAGPSGSGKSFLCSCLQKILPMPVNYIDAASLSAPSYKGASVQEVFGSIYEDSEDQKWKQCRVIIFDEADKMLAPSIRLSN